MEKLLKVAACLYAGISALSAETIAFDGNRDHGALQFDVEMQGNDGFTLKSVKIDEGRLNSEEINDITLIIPGGFQGKQTYIGCNAFRNLESDCLRLNIQFETTTGRRGPLYAQFPGCCGMMFADSGSITEIDFKGANTSGVNNMECMFLRCTTLRKIDFGNFDTSNVTNMGCLFLGCSSLEILDLGKFDTSNVWFMGAMFEGCDKLATLDLSNFDTRNVTTMYNMFRNCNNLSVLKYSESFVVPAWNRCSMFMGCKRELIH